MGCVPGFDSARALLAGMVIIMGGSCNSMVSIYYKAYNYWFVPYSRSGREITFPSVDWWILDLSLAIWPN